MVRNFCLFVFVWIDILDIEKDNHKVKVTVCVVIMNYLTKSWYYDCEIFRKHETDYKLDIMQFLYTLKLHHMVDNKVLTPCLLLE